VSQLPEVSLFYCLSAALQLARCLGGIPL
jgi:hypothetical protein